MSKPVAVISGGTYGLGRDVTVELAARGYEVVAFGLEQPLPSSSATDGIGGTSKALEERGLTATLIDADVSDEAAVRGVVDTAVKRFGRIDALVANAAIGPLGTVMETDPSLWDRIMAVNLRGTYLCARHVIPAMKRQDRGGAIVIVGSGAGWGKPNMAAYAASKGGLLALAQSLAYDHFHDHIRVNTVIPGGGGIVSGMSVGRVGGNPAQLSKHVPGTVAGRVTNGSDMASAIAFLISDQAAAISGTVLDVGCFFHQGGPIPPRPFQREDQ